LFGLVDAVSLQGQRSPATIPVTTYPTVTLGTAAVKILSSEAIIKIAIIPIIVFGEEFGAVGLRLCHQLID
jgi:hypothetical protein